MMHRCLTGPRRTVALALGILIAVGWWVSASSVRGDALAIGARAPEITGGPWVGSPPLTLAGLRGRVVLVEFWTYG